MEEEVKRCPYRPKTACSGHFYSNGVQSEWYEHVYEFEECIKEKCMLYDAAHKVCGRIDG